MPKFTPKFGTITELTPESYLCESHSSVSFYTPPTGTSPVSATDLALPKEAF